MTSVSLTVNGKSVTGEVEPRTLLVELLREHLRLTGTHVGCDTSQCGACTVHVDGIAIKSCTMLAVQADGADVLTIEGLAKNGELHPMQAAFKAISGFVTGDQGLGHVVMFVKDLDRGVRFYRDVLGMRISDFIRSLAFFHCNSRHHSVASIEAQAPKRLNHFMIQLQSLNDVGALYDKCQDEEVPIVRGLGRHTNDHMTSFYMKSPSGFDIEWGWGAREVDDATWQVQRHEKGSIWGHRAPTAVAAR